MIVEQRQINGMEVPVPSAKNLILCCWNWIVFVAKLNLDYLPTTNKRGIFTLTETILDPTVNDS